MKIQPFILGLFLTSSYASTVYKSVDEQGNVLFSDHPVAGTEEPQKLDLPSVEKQSEKRAEQQLKQFNEEDRAIRQRIDEKKQKLAAVQQKLDQAFAKLDVAKQAMQAAEREWQNAVNTFSRDATSYNQKRALLLGKSYEQAKSHYMKAEQELAKVQSERNSLR